MFGLGWSEMVLIGIVALIVVGPKDLPGMFRTLGQLSGKARGMAREFSRAMESAADDAGVKDISKTINAAANPTKFGTDSLKKAATTSFKPGGATEALSKERAESAAKFKEASAKAAAARKEKEAAAEAVQESAASTEPAEPSEDKTEDES